jgi:hypothetical protein
MLELENSESLCNSISEINGIRQQMRVYMGGNFLPMEASDEHSHDSVSLIVRFMHVMRIATGYQMALFRIPAFKD